MERTSGTAVPQNQFLLRCGQPRLARRIRRAHRHCFEGYLQLLGAQVHAIRRARSRETVWSWEQLFREAVRVEAALLALRWLSLKFVVGLSVTRADVSARLDVILSLSRSAAASSL